MPVITPDLMAAHIATAEPVVAEPVEEPVVAEPDHADAIFKEPAADEVDGDAAGQGEAHDHDAEPADELASIEPDAERPVLRPGFGSELLAGAEPVALPPSFDQLIARSATSTGSQSTSQRADPLAGTLARARSSVPSPRPARC